MSSILREQLVQGLNRSLLPLFALVAFYLMLFGCVAFYAVRTVRSRQWPPVGTTPLRLPAKKIKNSAVVWVIAVAVFVFGIAHVGLKIHSWRQNYQLVQNVMPFLKAPKEVLKSKTASPEQPVNTGVRQF